MWQGWWWRRGYVLAAVMAMEGKSRVKTVKVVVEHGKQQKCVGSFEKKIIEISRLSPPPLNHNPVISLHHNHHHHISIVFSLLPPPPHPPVHFHCSHHHHHHHISALCFHRHSRQNNHISLLFPSPLLSPHCYCFPITITFLFFTTHRHCHHHISILSRAIL